jgi:eukaryotic-like serine/threonine-protein kinase
MGSRHLDWIPPESFDEYRLVRALGRGSMGQVWLAHDTVLDRLVAVKFVAELPAHDPVGQRLLTEARAAARVQHPNIIAVYRVGEIGQRPYLISEYVCGDSLDKLARPVAWPRLLEIAIGLARGLAAAHRRGVLHRDLKPANAILSDTGEVKLLDFGLAKLLPQVAPHAGAPPRREAKGTLPGILAEPRVAPRASRELPVQPLDQNARTLELTAGAPDWTTSGDIALAEGTPPELPRVLASRGSRPENAPWYSRTRAGAVLGTPAYMPSEAWRGEPATPRSDVYSLGALLYELSAGAPPHRGDSQDAVRGSALDTDAPSLAVAAPGIDPRFAAIVDRCLRRDPAERLASGDAVREALEALTAGDHTSVNVRARPPREHVPLPSRRTVLARAAAVLVLAFALLASIVLGKACAPPSIDAASARHALPGVPAQRPPV